MRRRTFLSLAGVLAVGDGLAFSTVPALAAAAAPPQGELPFMHGYDAPALKSWTPEADRYAPYLRSRVPLARRIPAFAATQARPSLSPEPLMASLSNDYHETENYQLGYKYGRGFAAYALRFWQYLDMYGSWHGLPVDGEYGKPEPRFGVVNIPNPAWTDAAHRNGVRSLGCWFWPRPEEFGAYVEKTPDGRFPVADKMIEVAAYFGFDGYFINQEGDIAPSEARLLMEMLAYLNEKAPVGFHVQWYDSLTVTGQVSYENEFTAKNSPWITGGAGDSIFLNYAWNDDRMRRSREYAESIGLDPYRVVFAGTENQKYNFSPPYDPRFVFPERGPARTSWSVFGHDMVWARVDGPKDTVERQKPCYSNERLYWSGPRENPARTGRSLPPDGVDIGNPDRWDGIAHYVVEKSVIGSLPFVTRFNTGTGLGFFLGGSRTSSEPWYNIGIQDILPTWQWWADDGLMLDYDYETAWEGPTSLLVKATLTPGRRLTARLFKTRLAVARDTALALTYRTNAPGVLRIGLVFEDTPDTTTWLASRGSAEWARQEWPLAADHGRTIAALVLGFESKHTIGSYALNIGELRISSPGGRRPDRPTGFRVDRVAAAGADAATVFLGWDLAADLWHYDVLRVSADGSRSWLFRTYDEVVVLPRVPRDGDVETRLELVAVDALGRRSAPGVARFAWD